MWKLKNIFSKPTYKKNIRKGNAGVMIGVVILLGVFLSSAVVMDLFKMYANANYLQMSTDISADAAAITAADYKDNKDIEHTAKNMISANGFNKNDTKINIKSLNNQAGKKVKVSQNNVKYKYLFQNLYKTSNGAPANSYKLSRSATSVAYYPFQIGIGTGMYQGGGFVTAKWLKDHKIVPTNEHTRSPVYNNYIVNSVLNPGKNPRYLPHGGYTYCNWFMMDYLTCLGINQSDYVGTWEGNPTRCGLASFLFNDLTAASRPGGEWTAYTKGKIASNYSKYASIIQGEANKGKPVVIVMTNGNTPGAGLPITTGHCAVVVPSQNGSSLGRNVATAQSGSTTWNYRVFDISIWCQMDVYVTFFVHD